MYAFVRESLSPDAAQNTFTLYQPPRTVFPEAPVPAPPTKKHINPAMKARIVSPANYGPQRGLSTQGGTGGKESLAELGLVPQSVLLVRWDDADMNGELSRLMPELTFSVDSSRAAERRVEGADEAPPTAGAGAVTRATVGGIGSWGTDAVEGGEAREEDAEVAAEGPHEEEDVAAP